jgi:hypothetical protein
MLIFSRALHQTINLFFMQTPTFTAKFPLKVLASQSAKTPCPSPKATPCVAFGVRQQAPKNPCVRTHAGEFLIFESEKARQQIHFRLRHAAQNDFIKTIPLLFSQLQNLEVVFHNTDYVEQVFDTYYTNHAHLFLDWVKTFALIRSSCRTLLLENVIQSTDDDFLTAFDLFKLQCTRPKKKAQQHKQKILQTISTYFAHTPFTGTDIQNKTLIHINTITYTLKELQAAGRLKICKKQNGKKRFQLI